MKASKASKILYVCQSCGATSLRWLGRCPDCEAWNSYEERTVPQQRPAHAAGVSEENCARRLSDLQPATFVRTATGMGELDRVLGGGLVNSSVVLLSGEPGIGKSTLLLQICEELSRTRKVLYVSGEESQEQLKLRAERLQIRGDDIFLLTGTDVDDILSECERIHPDVMIIDSVQTLSTDASSSSPGSIAQVRECASACIRYGKTQGCAVFLVGHVNKEGGISGPKTLEHMVDTVLYFEGERTHSYRLIRAIKNRFGSTDEIGVFEMGECGLREIPNPSEILLAERPKNTSGSCAGCVMQGTRPLITEIQTLVTKTAYPTAKRTADGFDYNRMSLLLAVLEKRLGFKFFENDVYVNVAGGMQLSETSADLTIAMALISGIVDKPVPDDLIAFGEVGLAGEIRPIPHADLRVKEAVRLGFTRILLPKKNLSSHMRVPDGVELFGVSALFEVLRYLRSSKEA